MTINFLEKFNQNKEVRLDKMFISLLIMILSVIFEYVILLAINLRKWESPIYALNPIQEILSLLPFVIIWLIGFNYFLKSFSARLHSPLPEVDER